MTTTAATSRSAASPNDALGGAQTAIYAPEVGPGGAERGAPLNAEEARTTRVKLPTFD